MVRRWAIWQRASFDGDFVRLGTAQNVADPIGALYSEPGTQIPIVPAVGGNRSLTISVAGDLVLSGFR